jgi:hypothetical protein
VEVVTVLLRAGTQIDAQDWVRIVEIRVDLSSSVCYRGHAEVVTVLLSARAPIDAQTKVRSGRRISEICDHFI